MKIQLNHCYSRSEISKLLGGSEQAYLPFKGGRVTCGCFRTEEELNPGAPEEVLYGREYSMPYVEKAAEMVYEQGRNGESIPIFIRRGPAKWEYIGRYRCVNLSTDQRPINEKRHAYPRRGII